MKDKNEQSDVWVQLATRIPKDLHRSLKLFCVQTDVSVMQFCVDALTNKLATDSKKSGKIKRAS